MLSYFPNRYFWNAAEILDRFQDFSSSYPGTKAEINNPKEAKGYLSGTQGEDSKFIHRDEGTQNRNTSKSFSFSTENNKNVHSQIVTLNVYLLLATHKHSHARMHMCVYPLYNLTDTLLPT